MISTLALLKLWAIICDSHGLSGARSYFKASAMDKDVILFAAALLLQVHFYQF